MHDKARTNSWLPTVDDFTKGSPVQRGVVQLRSAVQQVALSSSYLAASDEAGSIYVWDFFNLQLVTDLTHTQQEEKPLGKVFLAPDLPILMYTRTNSKAVYGMLRLPSFIKCATTDTC